jgi:ribosome modulation factor
MSKKLSHGDRVIEGIEQEGQWAFLAGKSEANCPYSVYRTYDGSGVTFNRRYREAWKRGFRAAAQEEQRE